MKHTNQRFIVKMAYYNAKYPTFKEFLDATIKDNACMYKREIKRFVTKQAAVKFANKIKSSFQAGFPMVELSKKYKFSHMFILDMTKLTPKKFQEKGIDKYDIIWNN